MSTDTLESIISKNGCKAYVIYDTTNNPDMRYLTGFSIYDPVLYIHFARGDRCELIVPDMEAERARRETSHTVLTRNELGYHELYEKFQDHYLVLAEIIKSRCPEKILIPETMPAALAFAMSENQKIQLDKQKSIAQMRAIKTDTELVHITSSAQAAQHAMAHAISLIKQATVVKDSDHGSVLYHGETCITSEWLRFEIHKTLLMDGYHAKNTIVACGPDSSMPHWTGTGPILAHQPIIIDIFPSSDETKYYADMTRTISKGVPAQEIIDMHTAVFDALHMAQEMVFPGVNAKEIYQAVLTFFESRGFQTAGQSGFIHSLGHGVGLAVHEDPPLSRHDVPLHENQVIAIEPGLYYPGIGGVRIENLGIVTKTGFKTLTSYPETLVI